MNIIERLRARGVKDKDVAAVFGLERSTITLWASGRRQPNKTNRQRLHILAKLAGVDLSERIQEAA